MKKRMARLSALLFAATMTVGMAVPAMAATINLPSTNANATYELYQIFTGSVNDDGKMEEVTWGANGQLEDGTDASGTVSSAILKELADVTSGTDREKLDVITKYADLEEDAYKMNLIAGQSVTGLDAGYYLVKETTTANKADGTSEALSAYVVEILSEDDVVDIKSKVAVPEFDKQIKDETADAEDGATTDGWGESADHEINETFQFRLTASLPDDNDIDTYKAYQLVFKDTMNKAVTFEKLNSVAVYTADGTLVKTLIADDENTTDVIEGYQFSGVTTNSETGVSTFSLTIQDLKALLDDGQSLKGLQIVVEYDAHLNENAIISGSVDNIDTTEENVNKASLEYTRNPEWDGSGNPDNDETPEDYVFAFTYELPNLKTAEDGKTVLAGAKFKLYKSDKTTVIGLVWDSELNAYRPAKNGETALEYIESQTDGKFNIAGLDAGTYYLEETEAPGDYVKLADMLEIKITATHKEKTEGTSADLLTLTREIDGKDIGTGDNATNKVINKKPSNLPETGGMGTVLFYTLGGALVIGAGSTLVVKKRMEKK